MALYSGDAREKRSDKESKDPDMGDHKTRVFFLKRPTSQSGAKDIDPDEPEKKIKPSRGIKEFLGKRGAVDRFCDGGNDQKNRQRSDKSDGKLE